MTEDEITRGILEASGVKEHCYWFKRTITDLKENIGKKKARFFIDKSGNGFDEEAVALLEKLRNEKLHEILPKENISEYPVEWHGEDGIDPAQNEVHRKYIDKFSAEFYETLVGMINDGIENRKKGDVEDKLIQEISQHVTVCQEKSQMFHGREEVLKQIYDYVKGIFVKFQTVNVAFANFCILFFSSLFISM